MGLMSRPISIMSAKGLLNIEFWRAGRGVRGPPPSTLSMAVGKEGLGGREPPPMGPPEGAKAPPPPVMSKPPSAGSKPVDAGCVFIKLLNKLFVDADCE